MVTKSLPWVFAPARNDFFNEAIRELRLKPVWEWVVRCNEPDYGNDFVLRSAHYHSTEHMKQVTALALWLLQQEAKHKWQYQNGAYILAVACMFHDAYHTLGRESDEHNIYLACEALSFAMGKLNISQFRSDYRMIRDLISTTEFPFLEKNTPKNLIERCIRDADILYGMQPDAIDAVMVGLRLEVNRSPNVEKPFTAQQWADGRIEFLSGLQMYTATGKAIMKHALDPKNQFGHRRAITEWLEEDVEFKATYSHLIAPDDVMYIDLEDDTQYTRRKVTRVENAHPEINFYFSDGTACSLRNGERCVVVESNKK